MKRTKIIATIGPACESPEKIKEMILSGVNVFRLNFSHGNHTEHERYIETIKKVRKSLGVYVAILADLQGPKIRVGEINQELRDGQTVILTCGQATGNEIPVQYQKLYKDVRVNDAIFLDDGKIEVHVQKITGRKISAKVISGGLLTSKKGINLPNSSVSAEVITSKDKTDALFALSHAVDFLALSFVKSENDIKKLKRIIASSETKHAKIIAKIERHEALDRIDQILEAADGIMVARGDLGVEVSAQEVPIVQKKLIRKCLAVGKPCIVATQMLESMIQNPRSTRAETSDIANAILDGADATMLSGETSIGKYPLNAVRAMMRVAQNTEAWMMEDNITIGRRINRDLSLISDAVAMGGVQISQEVGAKYIIAATASGNNIRAVSKFRPHARIIGVTSKENVARQMALSWGVEPLVLHYDNNRELTSKISRWLKSHHLAEKGDKITVISGLTHNNIGGTNLIRVHIIE